jgi:hypothetical protein
MKNNQKPDAELVAEARMATADLNRLHAALARRGITVDWYFGSKPGELVVEYSRVTKEVL